MIFEALVSIVYIMHTAVTCLGSTPRIALVLMHMTVVSTWCEECSSGLGRAKVDLGHDFHAWPGCSHEVTDSPMEQQTLTWSNRLSRGATHFHAELQTSTRRPNLKAEMLLKQRQHALLNTGRRV